MGYHAITYPFAFPPLPHPTYLNEVGPVYQMTLISGPAWGVAGRVRARITYADPEGKDGYVYGDWEVWYRGDDLGTFDPRGGYANLKPHNILQPGLPEYDLGSLNGKLGPTRRSFLIDFPLLADWRAIHGPDLVWFGHMDGQENDLTPTTPAEANPTPGTPGAPVGLVSASASAPAEATQLTAYIHPSLFQ